MGGRRPRRAHYRINRGDEILRDVDAIDRLAVAHLHAQPLQLVDPGMGAAVVLVVAGDREHAVGNSEAMQLPNAGLDAAGVDIDQVPR